MRRALLALAVGGLLLAGCGSARKVHGACCDAVVPRTASLELDFIPNAVHVGIYAALARHLDAEHHLDLHVEIPGAATDAISELRAGRVDFAILDIHDLAIADAADPTHPPLVGILAIVQRPLAAVIAAPGIGSPRDLADRTVGVSGDPSDLAVLRSEIAGAGGNPARAHPLAIGYDAVADLLSGRVAAATAFWNDEGVTVTRRRPGFHVFRVDDYGAPAYPELVVCASAAGLRADPGRARALVATLGAGYGYALAHPAAAARDLESQVSGLDPSLVRAELPGLLQAFTGPERRFGALDLPRLRRWAVWERRFAIVRRTPDVAAMFDPGLSRAAGR